MKSKNSNAYYLLVVWGGIEVQKMGPWSSYLQRDRRAIEIHKKLDVTDSLFWMDRRGVRIKVGSFVAAMFEAEEYEHVNG